MPVVWNTVARTGADVRELQQLLAQQDSPKAADTEDLFDIAVVLCGVNDGKKLLHGRWPSVFREDLSALVSDLRQKAPDAHIHVPELPAYAHAPLFQTWPMCHLIQLFFDAFEAQKRFLADEGHIHSPAPPPEKMPSATNPNHWAVDGVHPSCEGYRLIGEWLGAALAEDPETSKAPFLHSELRGDLHGVMCRTGLINMACPSGH